MKVKELIDHTLAISSKDPVSIHIFVNDNYFICSFKNKNGEIYKLRYRQLYWSESQFYEISEIFSQEKILNSEVIAIQAIGKNEFTIVVETENNFTIP